MSSKEIRTGQQLGGKVAIVTGSSAGIGEGIARVFASRGCKVMISGRNIEAMEAIVKDLGADCASYVAGDITDKSVQSNLVDETVKRFGKIDVLVNNAGFAIPKRLEDEDDTKDSWDALVSLNMSAPRRLLKLCLPHLKKSKGNVINIGSYAGLRPIALPGTSYCVTKAALNHFTECMAVELADDGIRVNCINPGYIKTGIFTKVLGLEGEALQGLFNTCGQVTPLGRMGTSKEVGYAAAFLASDEAEFITGSKLSVDGGLYCEIRPPKTT